MLTEKFFGCCSLRKGTIIWGTITMLLDTAVLSGIVALLIKWDKYHDFWGFCCIPFVVDQLAAICLVFGAIKERYNWILFWLVVNGVLIFGFVIILIVLAVYVGYTCVLLMCLGVFVYVWACIFTYYKYLCEDSFGNSAAIYNSVVFSKV